MRSTSFEAGATRREMMLGAAAASLTSAGLTAAGPSEARAAPPTLKALAAQSGRVFGAAVSWKQLDDPGFAGLVSDQCAILTPEWEMKWGAVEVQRYHPDYGPAQRIVDFAKAHDQQVRGHTALWANNLPPWGRDALMGRDGRSTATARLKQILERFPGLADWDVANEAIEPRNGRPDNLRTSPLVVAMGPDWISDAFFEARKYAPNSQLYYNDYGLDYADPASDTKRRAVLGLLERLRKRGAPIDGLGIQAHLKPDAQPFDEQVFRRFLRDVAELGYEIRVTELDVNDQRLVIDRQTRDARVADEARRYLNVALDEPAVTGVICWGLSDRYGWLRRSKRFGRHDGIVPRPLPFDDALKPKPLFFAMADAFKHATPAIARKVRG
jgi:endo-1,4-beta-xylanase